MIEEFKSKCCGAEVTDRNPLAHCFHGDDRHYICEKCKNPCDIERIGASFGLKPVGIPADIEISTITTENLYLENVSGMDVNIYLVNGIKLYGKIIDHDDKTILLHTSVNNNLIYKSAIATIKVENERD